MPISRYPRYVRRAFLLASVALIGALSGLVPFAASITAQEIDTLPSTRSITVTGQGRVSVAPDTATFTVGVELEGTDLSELVAQAAERMNAVVSALEAAGVPAENIQTIAYQVTPISPDEEPGPPEPVTEPGAATPDAGGAEQHFRVTNLVQVQVDDISQLGALIDEALTAGANTVFGVSFSVADPAALTASAREEAYLNALQAAMDYAEIAGLSVGQVLSINEEGAPPVGTFAVAEEAIGGAAPIQPGTVDVVVTVRASFELEQPGEDAATIATPEA